MFAKVACNQTLQFPHGHRCNCCIAGFDHHQDPRRESIVSLSSYLQVEEKKEKGGTLMSLCKKVVSDRYGTNTGVTTGNINKCILNKL